MAKLTKDEFNSKYSERITDNDDLIIELMEDFADSISDESEEIEILRTELENRATELQELKQKYKQRFLDPVKDEKIDEKIDDIVEEKEIIDIKEI